MDVGACQKMTIDPLTLKLLQIHSAFGNSSSH